MTARPVRARASAHRPICSSRCSTWAGVAPFCGPKTRAAPLGPVRGLVTSHRTTTRDRSGRVVSSNAENDQSGFALCERMSAPSARSIPAPPSTQALPPSPTSTRPDEPERACARWSPSPVDDALGGTEESTASSIARPTVRAASTTAVPSGSVRYAADTGRPRASTVDTGTNADGRAHRSRRPCPRHHRRPARLARRPPAPRTGHPDAPPDPLPAVHRPLERVECGDHPQGHPAAPRRSPTVPGSAAPTSRSGSTSRPTTSGRVIG